MITICKFKNSRLNELRTNCNDKTKFTLLADLINSKKLNELFEYHNPDIVINLAAQAGVRYSIQNLMHILNLI